MNVLIQLREEVRQTFEPLKKFKGKQLTASRAKAEIRNLVQNYFSESRPSFISKGVIEADLIELDASMQELLKFTHKNTLAKKYLKVFKSVNANVNGIELKSIGLSKSKVVGASSGVDQRIIKVLSEIVPSGALSYEQALRDLAEMDRKSWRGTTAELRESLRQLLDRLAPDKDVAEQPGFKLDRDAKKPTMTQKVSFILRSRGLREKQAKPYVKSIDTIDARVGQYVRSIYESSSDATHTPEAPPTREDAIKIKDHIALAFKELLEIGS